MFFFTSMFPLFFYYHLSIIITIVVPDIGTTIVVSDSDYSDNRLRHRSGYETTL